RERSGGGPHDEHADHRRQLRADRRGLHEDRRADDDSHHHRRGPKEPDAATQFHRVRLIAVGPSGALPLLSTFPHGRYVRARMRRLAFPHPLTLLTCCVLLAAALSHVLPAGRYDRKDDPATGRSVVVAGTYHAVPRTPVGFFQTLVAIPKGLI